MLDGKGIRPRHLIDLYKQVAQKYPLASVEDPLDEEDFDGFIKVTKELSKTQIVGDDLFVTNVERLRLGVERGAANAMLFKVNQIGSLSQAMDSAEFAYRYGYGVRGIGALGRNRGRPHLRSGRGAEQRPDQDRHADPRRADRQAQPPFADRRGAWPCCPLRWAQLPSSALTRVRSDKLTIKRLGAKR